MAELTYHDLREYLPSRMTPTKMAQVTYTDLNKYVIVHVSKWEDPKTGKIHRVEYRARKNLHPGGDRHETNLEKWHDGVHVETLSATQLLARIRQWKYDPEPAIPDRVWWEVVQPKYDVLVQWKENEGGDIHLVEIIKYHQEKVFKLMRDGKCIYRTMTRDMYHLEEEKMNKWLMDNPPTGDSAAKVKGDTKPGVWDMVSNWSFFGKKDDRPPAYVPTPVSPAREDEIQDVAQTGVYSSNTIPKLDAVKYMALMKNVLDFRHFFDHQHSLVCDERGFQRKPNGDFVSSVRQKYHQITNALAWFEVLPRPWLWRKIRKDVSECMKKMTILRDEINTLDLEELNHVRRKNPVAWHDIPDIIARITGRKEQILKDIDTWCADPWGQEGPMEPPSYEEIYNKTEHTGNNEYSSHTVRKYKQNDGNNEEEYQEWKNTTKIKSLTKEEVRKNFPSARLDAKLTEIRTLLSALGTLASSLPS